MLLQLRDEALNQHSGMLPRRKASSPLVVGSSSLILTWHSSISQSPSYVMSSLFQQWSGLEEVWCWLLSQIRLSCIYPLPSRQLRLTPWLSDKHLSVVGYPWKTHTGLRMSRCGHACSGCILGSALLWHNHSIGFHPSIIYRAYTSSLCRRRELAEQPWWRVVRPV